MMSLVPAAVALSAIDDHGRTWSSEIKGTERVVGIVEFQGSIYVATTRAVFVLKDGKLEPIPFRIAEVQD